MIIDFHTHIYPPAVAAKAIAGASGLLTAATDGTAAGLLRSMDAAGISLSVALTLVTNPEKSRQINQSAFSEKCDRIIPLGSVHPHEKDPLATLDMISDMGFPGVKVHPEYQDFRFSDRTLYPLWERCAELGLFLVTHAGSDIKFHAPFRTNPRELADFAADFPGLRLVLAHMGGMDMWDDVERYLVGRDVWLDMAMTGSFNFTPEGMCRLIRAHGADKVLFGTDSPWLDQSDVVAFVRALPLSDAEKELIFSANARRLLQMQ